MTKYKKEKIFEMENHKSSEVFYYSLPDDISTINTTLDNYPGSAEVRWEIWPTEHNIERRVGGWVLVTIPRPPPKRKNYSSNIVRNRRLIRKFDSNIWYSYDKIYRIEESSFESFLVIKEEDKYSFFPEESKNLFPNTSNYNFDYMCSWNKSSVDFLIDAAWYRKKILKIQKHAQKITMEILAKKQNISIQQLINIEKCKEEEEKNIIYLNEWIKLMPEVSAAINYLENIRDNFSNKIMNRGLYKSGRFALQDLGKDLSALDFYCKK